MPLASYGDLWKDCGNVFFSRHHTQRLNIFIFPYHTHTHKKFPSYLQWCQLLDNVKEQKEQVSFYNNNTHERHFVYQSFSFQACLFNVISSSYA